MRLLLVEDTPCIGRAFQRLLQSLGHEVEWAQTFSAGVALCRECEYDLVLTDIGLPDGDGMDLIPTVGRVRAVVISAYSDPERIAAARALGYLDYIVKPCDFDMLKAVVERCALAS